MIDTFVGLLGDGGAGGGGLRISGGSGDADLIIHRHSADRGDDDQTRRTQGGDDDEQQAQVRDEHVALADGDAGVGEGGDDVVELHIRHGFFLLRLCVMWWAALRRGTGRSYSRKGPFVL